MINLYYIALMGGATGSAGITIWYAVKKYFNLNNRDFLIENDIDPIDPLPSHVVENIPNVFTIDPNNRNNLLVQRTTTTPPPKYEDIDLLN